MAVSYIIIHRLRGVDKFLRDEKEMKWVDVRRFACRFFDKEEKVRTLVGACQKKLPGLVIYEPYEPLKTETAA
jgi:hypothetical protein